MKDFKQDELVCIFLFLQNLWLQVDIILHFGIYLLSNSGLSSLIFSGMKFTEAKINQAQNVEKCAWKKWAIFDLEDVEIIKGVV